MAPTLKVDHAAMKAVVDRIDRLLETLDSSGTAGSYSGLSHAAPVAEAVRTVSQSEMADFVADYNVGFGNAAGQYRALCDTLVDLRNAVARTANIHAGNDELQASAFHPLSTEARAASTTRDRSTGSTPSGSSDDQTQTHVLAPGALTTSARSSATAGTQA